MGFFGLRPAMIALLTLAFLLGSCTRPAPPDREARLAALDPEAKRLYSQLEQEYLLRRDARVLELGERLFEAPFAHRLPVDAATMMIVSALRMPDLDRVRDLALAVPRHFGADVLLEQPMLEAVGGLAEAGRPADAIEVLAELTRVLVDPPRLQAAMRQAPALAGRLTDQELQGLAMGLADTPLADLLQKESRRRDVELVVAAPRPIDRSHLGVLVPLTGRYARFGNAFLAGVHRAALSVSPPPGRSWRIVHEDTEGDVVTAALAARRLVENEGSEVLIGALLSATTATAALVADHLGVSLISPTATHERLSLLGEQVLQTNLTGPAEAEILARLACEVLLKERFAIIAPDTPEGVELAGAFKNSVERFGGSVVRQEVFDSSAIDFGQQVARLRAVRPEVIFAPASVDQMILLGPQLDFYRAGALVLGTSEWNSLRLLQRAGSVMERAIFPVREVFYPQDWPADFEREWPASEHDEEATRIARSAYLAARLVLRTMADADQDDAGRLIARLRAGLVGGWAAPSAAGAYGAAVRLVENGQIVPFPGHLYVEALRRRAPADTTDVDPDDVQTLLGEAGITPQRTPWPAAADTAGQSLR